MESSTSTSSGYQVRLQSVGETELESGFVEFWFKKENFTILPEKHDHPVMFEEILGMPNSQRGE
jgi:hypothetical protein